jgi:hypothetical protein
MYRQLVLRRAGIPEDKVRDSEAFRGSRAPAVNPRFIPNSIMRSKTQCRAEFIMKSKLICVLLMLILSASIVSGQSKPPQQSDITSLPQTVTLYSPHDKATVNSGYTRACFSFKLGTSKRSNSTDWELGYGLLQIGNEDWFSVSGIDGARSVIEDLGKLGWSDPFKVPVLEPLPELKEGEKRQITVDASGDTHEAWKKSTKIFARAEVDHMYVVHVKDRQSDFYAMFHLEQLEQGKYCTISWKRVPTPEK